MSYCLNPVCSSPFNSSVTRYCQSCGMDLTLVDQYRVDKMISSGGFGRTFLARDLTHRRRCVIKQLHPIPFTQHPSSLSVSPHAAPNFAAAELERFRQEVQRLDELGHHSQIPQLWDAIEQPVDPYPALYIVQEFIAGDTLEDDLSRHGPWPEAKVRSLLTSILPVLQFIHDHHVIHRDIKPQNIICAPTFVLVDFGAAKRTSRTQTANTGTIIGSAGYAAPEQTMGKAVFASDLYSLGVTCIHLLTAMHPFELYSISQDDWVWPQYLLTPVSPTLTHVLNTLLRRSITQRYRTAAAALSDLQPPTLTPHCQSATSPSWQHFNRSTLPPMIQVEGAGEAGIQNSKSEIQNPKSQILLSHTLSHHTHSVTALTVSMDSTLFASGDRRGTILLWNLASGTLLHRFPARTLWKRTGHGDRITALRFTSDGSTLISSSADGTIKQWDLTQRKLLTTLTGEGWVISTLVLHPDDGLLISGAANGAIDLWDLDRQQFIQRLWTHTDEISGLEIASDRYTLVSSSHDGSLIVWDLRTAAAIASIRAHHQGVRALALHPNGPMVISGGGDRTVRLWTIPQFCPIWTLELGTDPVISLAIHPSGQMLATPQDETHIQLWTLNRGLPESKSSPLRTMDARVMDARTMDATMNEGYPQRVACLSQDWDLTGLVFSPKGDRFLSSSRDGTIKIWRSYFL